MCKTHFSQRSFAFFFTPLFIGICFFSPAIAFAKKIPAGGVSVSAEQPVSGTIRDAATGSPLSGASIRVKGSLKVILSDAKGSFSITVPDNNSILVITYVGYATQEITVGNRSVIEVALQINATDLTQVVVVGYGTQNKKDVTGAVKSLKSESFNKGIINSPQQLLQGKVSGVNVTSASG
ncbi:MAG: carboxypeptidase-like regulatory domain-containing protein, partial [Chitinophagaceae bacterium]